MRWIDTHCHLDAAEFSVPNQPLAPDIRAQAAIKGVAHCVIPAVEVANFDAVRTLAHQLGDSYCLGIHPLYVPQATDRDLAMMDAQLAQHRNDPRLVAVGEIGLDTLSRSPQSRCASKSFYREQPSWRSTKPIVLRATSAITLKGYAR